MGNPSGPHLIHLLSAEVSQEMISVERWERAPGRKGWGMPNNTRITLKTSGSRPYGIMNLNWTLLYEILVSRYREGVKHGEAMFGNHQQVVNAKVETLKCLNESYVSGKCLNTHTSDFKTWCDILCLNVIISHKMMWLVNWKCVNIYFSILVTQHYHSMVYCLVFRFVQTQNTCSYGQHFFADMWPGWLLRASVRFVLK